jgi:aryl-alcohol dehydrogenase-like predicted oxidoreductase
LGGATFGREIDEGAAFQIMDSAIETGINFFDTAEIYRGGRRGRCNLRAGRSTAASS